MSPPWNYPLENFKGLLGKGNLEKSNETVLFHHGQEERRLVLSDRNLVKGGMWVTSLLTPRAQALNVSESRLWT